MLPFLQKLICQQAGQFFAWEVDICKVSNSCGLFFAVWQGAQGDSLQGMACAWLDATCVCLVHTGGAGGCQWQEKWATWLGAKPGPLWLHPGSQEVVHSYWRLPPRVQDLVWLDLNDCFMFPWHPCLITKEWLSALLVAAIDCKAIIRQV